MHFRPDECSIMWSSDLPCVSSPIPHMKHGMGALLKEQLCLANKWLWLTNLHQHSMQPCHPRSCHCGTCIRTQSSMPVGCLFGFCSPSLKPWTRRFLGSNGWAEREVTASSINEQRGRWLKLNRYPDNIPKLCIAYLAAATSESPEEFVLPLHVQVVCFNAQWWHCVALSRIYCSLIHCIFMINFLPEVLPDPIARKHFVKLSSVHIYTIL